MAASPCDRGALVNASSQFYTATHACDGYADCRSGEDELWQPCSNETSCGAERVPCPNLGRGDVGALRCIAWLALLAAGYVCSWAVGHRREREARLFAWPFALPFLVGCCVGPLVTLLLVVPAPWLAGPSGLLLGDRQCAAPFVLALGLTAVLGGLVLQVWHTVRLTGRPLQAQMAPPGKSAAAPLVVAVAVQLGASVVGVAVDPWRTRIVGSPLDGGVRCGCSNAITAAVVFGVNGLVVGVTLVAAVWLAMGPGYAVSSKFRFYPWMQECRAVATSILVWFGCLLAAVITLAVSDTPWAHLPATYAAAFAYNASVLVSLLVVWVPKAAVVTRSRQAKHERVTTLHSLISANDTPW